MAPLLTFAVISILFFVYHNEAPALALMRHGATFKRSQNNANYVLCASADPVTPPFAPTRIFGSGGGK